MNTISMTFEVRVYVLVFLVAIGLCGIAWVWVSLFHAMDGSGVPAGFERTCIPGVFVDRRLVDIGTIAPDNVVEATFRLFNADTRTYLVKNISADCTCATISLQNPTLRPKATLTIPVRMNARAIRASAFQKAVAVTLIHDGDDVQYKDVFRFRGEIDLAATFVAWPGIIDCGTVTPGATVMRRIYFKADSAVIDELPSRLSITEFPCHMRIDQPEYKNRLHVRSMDVTVVFPTEMPPGPFESSLTIEMVGLARRRMDVAVRARIEPKITTIPRRILITVEDNSDPMTTLMIHSSDGTPFAIKNISCSLPIQWSILTESLHPDSTTLTLSVPQTALVKETIGGGLHLDMADGTVLVVPIIILCPRYERVSHHSHEEVILEHRACVHLRRPRAYATRPRGPPDISQYCEGASLKSPKLLI